MANTIDVRTVIDGSRKLVVSVYIKGDGSGEETDTVLIDASSFSPPYTSLSVIAIHSSLLGFTADLAWDATVNVPFMAIPDFTHNPHIRDIGGIVNTAGAGKTGDILITTFGLANTSDHGNMILEFSKHFTDSKHL